MKIYIGPYVGDGLRSQIHTKYMNKKYGFFIWEENTTKFEHFLEKLDDVLNEIYNYTINQILWRRKRKIKIRIDHYDTWSMDHTLSLIITPMLVQLKNNKHGAPYVDDDDVPEELRSTSAPPKKNEGDTDENHFKRWDWVLDEMIFAFSSEKNDDLEEHYINGNIDKENLIKKQNRIFNGFRLFGKYYMNLWD